MVQPKEGDEELEDQCRLLHGRARVFNRLGQEECYPMNKCYLARINVTRERVH